VRLIAVDEQEKKKKSKKSKKGGDTDEKATSENGTSATPNTNGGELTKRPMHVHSAPRVEEVEDE